MKIVVLDGHTLNPGDLSWDGLRALGDCTIHDNTPNDDVVRVAAGADGVRLITVSGSCAPLRLGLPCSKASAPRPEP